ncbi:FIGNL1-interacting regulator of recombination and mitosis-like [Haliotis cracherodii]|uniref:FIGNL1-interacting regulator of recombination and mitosis-like n=1 Tax=Haliotis cracherodii TaxID=6455 RepID=UPI0039E8A006
MSQAAFLEDVVSWDEKKCLENLDEALPKLVTCLHQVNDIEEEIGILKIICHSFLPCVKQHEAEKKIFSKIAGKTCKNFDKILDGIRSGINQGTRRAAGEITQSLEMAVEVVDCVESCVRGVSSSQLEVEHVHSLPGCTVHILAGSYTHCKDSGDLYKDLLGLLSEPLSSLFRKAHSLQMAFLNMFDRTTIAGEASDQDVQDLCQVCDGLFEVCQIVTALDMKVVVSLWKAVSKISSQYKHLLQGQLDMCRMIRHLCREVVTGYQYLFQLLPRVDEDGMVQSQGDEKAFVKSLKILGFQVKILVILIKDFRDYLGQCEKEVFELILNIHRLLPPSLSAPKLQLTHLDQIRSQISVAVDPLLSSLTGNRHFRKCVTRRITDVPEDHLLPLLLVQTLILEMLPKLSGEDQDQWIHHTVYPEDTPVDNILQAVFYSIGKCYVELAVPVSLPGVIVPGKQQRDASLYEFVCTHLCGFIGSFPARHFAVLEEILFANSLSPNPYQASMAVDCWCFMARYGSAELCYQHVLLLVQMYQDLTKSPHSHLATSRLSAVLHRLAKFLAPQHQQSLLKEFPPSENVQLWSELPLVAMTTSMARDVMEELITRCTKSMHNWINTSEKTLGQLDNVNVCVKCLAHLYSSPSLVEKCVTPQLQSVVLEKVAHLWRTLAAASWDLRPALEALLAAMYRLSAQLVGFLQTPDILQILTVTQRLLVQPSSVLLRLEVVGFLQKCGAAKLAPSFEQSQTLHKLPEVFCPSLRDPHCIVQHRALQAFTSFAEETVHESVVPECLERDASLQDKVVAFLNKVPSAPSGGKMDTVEYLRLQLQMLNSSDALPWKQGTITTLYEPTSKRPRTESDGGDEETQHHKILKSLQTACTDVQTLLRGSKQPSWFVSTVQQTVAELTQCLQNS